MDVTRNDLSILETCTWNNTTWDRGNFLKK
jgi:hypothetical protein